MNTLLEIITVDNKTIQQFFSRWTIVILVAFFFNFVFEIMN